MLQRFVFVGQVLVLCLAGLLLSVALDTNISMAQSASEELSGRQLEFPPGTEAWINSAPLSAESLRGKGVVLWFYEEGCPKCASKWPELISLSRQYSDKPVVFLAVNSGTPRRAVLSYVNKHKVPWPVIVDANRSFEQLCEVKEISLRNIYQMKVLTPQGQLTWGDWRDFPKTVERALEGAAFRVEPSEVPDELHEPWMAIEIGNYIAAGPSLRQALGSKNEAVRNGAAKLQAAVDEEIKAMLETAGVQQAQQASWAAYKTYRQIEQKFRGYDLPDAVHHQQELLAEDVAVQNELAAFQTLSRARKLGQRGSPASIRRAVGMLERIVEKFPDTEAAGQAQEILLRVQSS